MTKTLLLSLLLVGGCSAHTPPPLPVLIQQISPSVVHLQCTDHTERICSGFSIAPGIYLTADHCLEEGAPTIDGEATTIVMRDSTYDVAVLKADVVRPALPLGVEAPLLGESIVTAGYAYGFSSLSVRSAIVSTLVDMAGVQKVIYDNPTIQGMSGGPIVNEWGDVIGIVQRSNNETAMSLVYEDMVRLVGDYWQGE